MLQFLMKKIELILDAGFNEVIFSVDAGTKTYEEIKLKENLIRL